MDATLNLLPPRDRTVRALRALLVEGRFGQGEAMPSERILANELGVSRDTVRAALKDLTRQGLVASSKARVRRVVATGSPVAPSTGIVSKTIAFISENPIPQEAFKTMPTGFESKVFTSCATAIQEAGLHVLAIRPASLSEQEIAGMASQGLGGMVLFSSAVDSPLGRKILETVQSASLPFVVQGDSPALANFDRCYSDHEAGAYELTRLLIARGKRRILPFWRFASDFHWLRCRVAGYERAMKEAGLSPLVPLRTPDLPSFADSQSRQTFDQVVRLMAGYLAEPTGGAGPVDAIMVATDPHAYEVAAALALIGRDPAQFPIVGYDNDYTATSARAWSPVGPIATAEKDNPAVGREMALLLTQRMQGLLPIEPQQRRIAPRIIEISDP
jgi:DNA-binding LacI/PurR family transcriptional regulator